MTDRLRELLDLVLGSLDDPEADGRALAGRAHFSRDHLDRLLAAATGESPVALRRRLLLERAAWQLSTGTTTPSEAAAAAGYGSLAAFSRAFSRAYGVAPSPSARAAASPGSRRPTASTSIRPPACSCPGRPSAPRDLAERLVGHHLDRQRALLEAAATLPREALERPVRPGLVVVWFEGEEPSAALMAERLVFTLEVWVAAIAGREQPTSHSRRGPARPPRPRGARVRPDRAHAPRPRGVGRRVRRRAVRAAAVVHLRRGRRPRPDLRRDPPRAPRRRAGGARRGGARHRRSDPLGAAQAKRLTKSSAVWATSCQPLSITSACPRSGTSVISVTPGLRFCRL